MLSTVYLLLIEGLLTAVPSELIGMYYFHQKFGRLQWAQVLEPVVNLSINGYQVTPLLSQNLQELGADGLKNLSNFAYAEKIKTKVFDYMKYLINLKISFL